MQGQAEFFSFFLILRTNEIIEKLCSMTNPLRVVLFSYKQAVLSVSNFLALINLHKE